MRRAATLFVALGVFLLAGCEPTNLAYAPNQPIVYSHAVHAGALKIPCQYCHYAAERSRFAGIPPAQLCMNCHKQALKDHPEVLKVKNAIERNEPIRWVRVHKLADFATFDHSAHVAKNVQCQTCHGPVEQMGRVEQFAPLTMGWCLDCHRKSLPASGAAAGAPNVLAAANRLTDCAVCHH